MVRTLATHWLTEFKEYRLCTPKLNLWAKQPSLTNCRCLIATSILASLSTLSHTRLVGLRGSASCYEHMLSLVCAAEQSFCCSMLLPEEKNCTFFWLVWIKCVRKNEFICRILGYIKDINPKDRRSTCFKLPSLIPASNQVKFKFNQIVANVTCWTEAINVT